MVEEKKADWAAIAANPRFAELHHRKVGFLFGWWIISIIIYVIFLVCSILFAQSFFAWRVIGDINIGYLLILVLFVYCWWLAGYYASWANKVSDRITTELVEELKEGGMQK
ncbi:MAG TPA: DUF485 domain-containing protein [Desulfomonilaceae bacterium]|nr:DUF485 domain-containing protein [Desulfomonilaceae bacterium]